MADATINIDLEGFKEFVEEAEEFLENAEKVKHSSLIFTAPHAIYVNYDTQYNSYIPPDELLEWVKWKWADLPGGMKEAALSGDMEEDSEKHKKSVMWMINNSFKEGKEIEGVFFIEKTYFEYKENLEDYLEEFLLEKNDGEIIPAIQDLVDDMESHSIEILADNDKIVTGALASSTEKKVSDDDIIE